MTITVTSVDRDGKLLATEDRGQTPDPLQRGGGTFKFHVDGSAQYIYIKVNFSNGSGSGIPWDDKSGKDAHQ